MEAIIVHGGAGTKRNLTKRKYVILRAAKEGYRILQKGGTAVDAVIQAIIVLEDSPYFNAGTGSNLNLEGELEMDASIMTNDLRCGAVAGIQNVKNPIVVAKLVMEKTDHVILSGSGAERFARAMGIEWYNPITERSKKQYSVLMKKVKDGIGTRYFPHLPDILRYYSMDTVGAVAIDRQENMATANSTAGILLKMPGRIGDTPVFGAGLYANRYGAVCATGYGEGIIRLCLSRETLSFIKRKSAQEGVNRALKLAKENNVRCGLIAIDRRGNIGWGHIADAMPCAWMVNGRLDYSY